MAYLRIRFRFNPGRHGAPQDKLGQFVIQSEKFLRALTSDLGEEAKKGQWIANNFGDGSAQWDSQFANPVNQSVAAKGNMVLRMLSDGSPLDAVNQGVISYWTITEFSKISEAMSADEHFEIGIYDDYDAPKPAEWKKYSYSKIAEVRQLLNVPYITYGSLQGVMHDWVMEGNKKSFTVRELSTNQLVKCFYPEKLHDKIHESTGDKNSVVLVYGDMKWDRANNLIIEVDAADLQTIRKLTEAEFQGLFGAAPGYIGNMTSSEYIEWLRGDEE